MRIFESQTTNFQITLLLTAVLTACGSQPRSTYPILEQNLESDINLNCSDFEDELLKANAIRDAIYEEQGDVVSDAYQQSAFDLAIDPVTGILSSLINGVTTSNQSKTYLEAANAAEQRMQQILIYKEQHNCANGPTANNELTDSSLLTKLRELDARLVKEEIARGIYISERRILLDSLR